MRHAINVYEFKSIRTHWIALYLHGDNVTYFDSWIHFKKKFKKLIENTNIRANIYETQASDSLMCGYFWIGFIDFIFKGKCLLDYTDLSSPNKY